MLESRDGGEGTQIFRAEHEAIDAVIMDWKMPGLDGNQWVGAMLPIDPNARTIFCTAYEIPESIRQEKPYELWLRSYGIWIGKHACLCLP